mgnify:CR=1 FL=1
MILSLRRREKISYARSPRFVCSITVGTKAILNSSCIYIFLVLICLLGIVSGSFFNRIGNVFSNNKNYKYNVKDDNKGFLYNLFNSKEKQVKAVDNISFEVEEGETVAFIGTNGAGKSTTIKMLTGILYPTSGEIKVYGLTPIKDRDKLAYKIGTVFGQRSQLLPNLPLTDSMEMFGIMYDMSKEDIKKRTQELTNLFD